MDSQTTASVENAPGWPRAAIYFAPAADSALHGFGADWLGRDALIGAPRPTPTVDGIAPEHLAAITADARRYGFHATLRAPFHPADGVDITRIIAAAEAFGAARKPFDLSLEVGNHKGFLALTPVQAPAALGVLEADLLAHFDSLVRPPSPDELARRRQANLNPAQDAHLRRWGYPYVLDQFHFHMTLTTRLSDPAELATLFDALRARAAPVLAKPLRVDAIAVFVEAEKGADFICAARCPFGA